MSQTQIVVNEVPAPFIIEVFDEAVELVNETVEETVVEVMAGARGVTSQWLPGTDAPEAGDGSIGDMFIVTSGEEAGDLYKKWPVGWTLVGNILGPVGGVNSVNGVFGPDAVITKSLIGLGSVDNTADITKPISTPVQAALDAIEADLAIALSTSANDAVVVKLSGAQTIADVKTFTSAPVVPNNAFAITKVKGLQTALDSKESTGTQTVTGVKTFSLSPIVPTPTTAFQVAPKGYVDTAVASLVDAAPGTLDTLNELAAALGDDPNFAATTASSIALKAPLASPAFTGTVTGITKAMVGLGNVDNTTDVAKPVSTAQQTALDLKAPLASPTFTGTVAGITKTMVGLGSVDNTADAAKPVSTAQQTALNLKVNNTGSETITGQKTFNSAQTILKQDGTGGASTIMSLQVQNDHASGKPGILFNNPARATGVLSLNLSSEFLFRNSADSAYQAIRAGAIYDGDNRVYSASNQPDARYLQLEKTSGSLAVYRDVVRYSGGSASMPRYMRINTTLPVDGGHMIRMHISGKVDSYFGGFDGYLTIYLYNIGGGTLYSPIWDSPSGLLPNVYVSKNASNQLVVLFDYPALWNYPDLVVEEVFHNYGSSSSAMYTGWTITNNSDNTGLSAIVLAAQGNTSPRRVVHGAVAGTARPTGIKHIEWVGSVSPTNATTNDTWWNTA